MKRSLTHIASPGEGISRQTLVVAVLLARIAGAQFSLEDRPPCCSASQSSSFTRLNEHKAPKAGSV